jgi:hypothetical protein
MSPLDSCGHSARSTQSHSACTQTGRRRNRKSRCVRASEVEQTLVCRGWCVERGACRQALTALSAISSKVHPDAILNVRSLSRGQQHKASGRHGKPAPAREASSTAVTLDVRSSQTLRRVGCGHKPWSCDSCGRGPSPCTTRSDQEQLQSHKRLRGGRKPT